MLNRSCFRQTFVTRICVVLAAALILIVPQWGLAEIKLGKLTFSSANALPLMNPMMLSDGLKSFGYVNSVGGVAFGAVAHGQDGAELLQLLYEASKTDGKRLSVVIETADGKKHKLVAPIYDWQLVPTARFASTQQHACFTLFGTTVDPAEQELRLSRGERIFGYHPAFKDTLLGLRLFQADLLIIHPDACDLPRDGGSYILGKGEQRPNLAKNQTAYQTLHNGISASRGTFQSYVVCDHEQDVVFSASSGLLSITGNPHWYCWRRKIDEPAEMTRLQDTANTRANELLNQEFQKDQQKLEAADVDRKWTDEFQREVHGKHFDKILSANLLQPMPELSHFISDEVMRLDGVNPEVYRSLVITMRYAALFRCFQQKDRQAFDRFVGTLNRVPVVPSLETPAGMNPVEQSIH